MTRSLNNGTPPVKASLPGCPKCGGPVWDNRTTKRNPKAPDFRCRDRSCGGAIWPGQQIAALLFAPAEPRRPAEPARLGDILRRQARSPLRKRYLEVTDFVLMEVRPRYQAAGVTCGDATLAAIAATLFIAACRPDGRGGGGGG